MKETNALVGLQSPVFSALYALWKFGEIRKYLQSNDLLINTDENHGSTLYGTKLLSVTAPYYSQYEDPPPLYTVPEEWEVLEIDQDGLPVDLLIEMIAGTEKEHVADIITVAYAVMGQSENEDTIAVSLELSSAMQEDTEIMNMLTQSSYITVEDGKATFVIVQHSDSIELLTDSDNHESIIVDDTSFEAFDTIDHFSLLGQLPQVLIDAFGVCKEMMTAGRSSGDWIDATSYIEDIVGDSYIRTANYDAVDEVLLCDFVFKGVYYYIKAYCPADLDEQKSTELSITLHKGDELGFSEVDLTAFIDLPHVSISKDEYGSFLSLGIMVDNFDEDMKMTFLTNEEQQETMTVLECALYCIDIVHEIYPSLVAIAPEEDGILTISQEHKALHGLPMNKIIVNDHEEHPSTEVWFYLENELYMARSVTNIIDVEGEECDVTARVRILCSTEEGYQKCLEEYPENYFIASRTNALSITYRLLYDDVVEDFVVVNRTDEETVIDLLPGGPLYLGGYSLVQSLCGEIEAMWDTLDDTTIVELKDNASESIIDTLSNIVSVTWMCSGEEYVAVLKPITGYPSALTATISVKYLLDQQNRLYNALRHNPLATFIEKGIVSYELSMGKKETGGIEVKPVM